MGTPRILISLTQEGWTATFEDDPNIYDTEGSDTVQLAYSLNCSPNSVLARLCKLYPKHDVVLS